MKMTVIQDSATRLGVLGQNRVHDVARLTRRRIDRVGSERGEGVISAAIAVLIFALIGSLMWVAYSKMFAKSSAKTSEQVDKIGDSVAP